MTLAALLTVSYRKKGSSQPSAFPLFLYFWIAVRPTVNRFAIVCFVNKAYDAYESIYGLQEGYIFENDGCST